MWASFFTKSEHKLHIAPCRYELATQGAGFNSNYMSFSQTFVKLSCLMYYLAVHIIDETAHVIFQTTVMFQLIVDCGAIYFIFRAKCLCTNV